MRCLLFFPNNPVPVRSGSHRRFMEVVEGLNELGHELHLVSSRFTTDVPWTQSSVRALEAAGIRRVWIYDRLPPVEALRRRFHRYQYRRTLDWSWLVRAATPSSLKDYFERVAHKISPELVFIFYGAWSELLSASLRKSVRTVVDINDLMSRNHAMQSAIRPFLNQCPLNPAQVAPRILDPRMYESGFPLSDGAVHSLDAFDVALAISRPEAQELSERCQNAEIIFLPFGSPADCPRSDYQGKPVFFASDNLFNRQGHCFLSSEVASQIRNKRMDFRVELHGLGGDQVADEDTFQKKGPAISVRDVYRRAPFALCPTFGGTGEQSKISEAMAHGVPVVVLESGLRGAPVISGENGWVASGPEDFAEGCLRLSEDRALCRRLGEAAYETIRSLRSREKFIGTLDSALS